MYLDSKVSQLLEHHQLLRLELPHLPLGQPAHLRLGRQAPLLVLGDLLLGQSQLDLALAPLPPPLLLVLLPLHHLEQHLHQPLELPAQHLDLAHPRLRLVHLHLRLEQHLRLLLVQLLLQPSAKLLLPLAVLLLEQLQAVQLLVEEQVVLLAVLLFGGRALQHTERLRKLTSLLPGKQQSTTAA